MNLQEERLARFRVPRFALFALAFAFGCETTDTKGWLVDRTRVLGVRVEASAEPARASVVPGEKARLTWLVGAPNGTGRLGWAYAVCAPPPGNYAEPRCVAPVLASASGASDGELVTMELDVPAASDLEELLVLAAFCEDGDVALDAGRFEASCSSGAPSRLASGAVRLAAAGPNLNPEIAPDTVLFDGAPLAVSEARAGSACANEPSTPLVVSAGSKHVVAVRFRGDEREALPGTQDGVESILASHVVTAGELERQYSMLDPTDAVPKEVSVEWTAPRREDVPDGGRLVEVYVVLRDGRGGAAFARRTVCVRP